MPMVRNCLLYTSNQSCLDLNELDHALDEMLELLKADKHHLPYVFDTITLYDDLYELSLIHI